MRTVTKTFTVFAIKKERFFMARIKRETSFLTDDAYEAMYERIVSFIFNRTGNFLINYPNTIHNDIDSMYMNEKMHSLLHLLAIYQPWAILFQKM